jgi:hypothetical protein
MSDTQLVAEKPKTKVASIRRSEAARAARFSDFKIYEQDYIRFTYTLPVGWEFSWCLDPGFWVHCCHLFQADRHTNSPDKVGSIIEVRTQDHEFYAELYVRAVQERGLVVSVLREPVRVAPKELGNGKHDDFVKRWVGGKGGYYQIVRTLDGAIVSDGKKLQTKEMAQDFIDKMKVD